jgi:hypothetical protein
MALTISCKPFQFTLSEYRHDRTNHQHSSLSFLDDSPLFPFQYLDAFFEVKKVYNDKYPYISSSPRPDSDHVTQYCLFGMPPDTPYKIVLLYPHQYKSRCCLKPKGFYLKDNVLHMFLLYI